jgi:hypothetical protein
MKVELRNNQDFFAGLMFVVIGLIAVIISQKNYPMGTSFQMGPGYFPTLLGGVMIVLGLWIMVRGLLKGEKVEGVWGIRPVILLTLAIIAFGFIMDRFGLVPALIALFFIGALAGHEFKFKEVLILAIVMTVVSWAVFVYALGLSFRLFFWWR